MRLDGWFADVGWDELGDCGNGNFFFVRGSVYGSPTASVLGSFFVKDMKSVSGRCGSFKHESILLGMSTPPLQMLEVETNWNQE